MPTTLAHGRTHVFLCHASADKKIVGAVARALKKASINVWLDTEQIAPGDNVVLKISEGLAQSRFVLVFLSKQFVASKWVHQEWSHVFHEEVESQHARVIPVLIGDIPDELPSPLSLLKSKHYVDLRGKSGDAGLKTLVSHLQTHITPQSASTAEAQVAGGLLSTEVLTIRYSGERSNTLRLCYFLGEMKLQETSVLSRHVQSLQLAISTELPRLLYRYGRDHIASVEEVARRVSPALLPSQVTALLLQKKIKEIRVVAAPNDPVLPWELLHDGNNFVALNVPIATIPESGRAAVAPFRAKDILFVDAAIGGISRGFDLGGVKWPALERVNLNNTNTARASVRSRDDLDQTVGSIPSTILHLTSHMAGSEQGLMVGDESVSPAQLAAIVRRSDSLQLVVLSACNSGSAVSSASERALFEQSPAYVVAMVGSYVVGTIGWLEMTTSSVFDAAFLSSLVRTQRPEQAMLEARQRVAKDGLEWWLFALFAPRASFKGSQSGLSTSRRRSKNVRRER